MDGDRANASNLFDRFPNTQLKQRARNKSKVVLCRNNLRGFAAKIDQTIAVLGEGFKFVSSLLALATGSER